MAHDIADTIINLSQELNKKDIRQRRKDFVANCYKNTFQISIFQEFTVDIDFEDPFDRFNDLSAIILYKPGNDLYIKSIQERNIITDGHQIYKPDVVFSIKDNKVLEQLGSFFRLPKDTHTYILNLSIGRILNLPANYLHKKIHHAYYPSTTQVKNIVLDAIALMENMVIIPEEEE